ncbi:MAG: hypothetical protein IPL32_04905 [Chloracidobacterium sp.]|nr:hypothetical protein [Chloracidobacterium sp.]
MSLPPLISLDGGVVREAASDVLNLNDGTTQGGVTYESGIVGQAFAFDGTGEVVVPNHPSLNVQQLTFDAWVYPTSYGNGSVFILSKSDSPLTWTIQYEFALSSNVNSIPNGNLVFNLVSPNQHRLNGLPDDGGGWVDSGGAVPLNTWTHVALTFDGSTAKTFVNGSLTRTVNGLSGSINTTTETFKIGSGGLGSNKFLGKIDEVDVFNRALSEAEIQAIFDAGTQGKCLSPAIRGAVTYGNPASPTTKFISNVTVSSTVGSPSLSTTTAAPGGTAGQYTLIGFGAGSYTVSLAKTTGQNGISSGDAARVAQHVAGTSFITSDRQKIAADVTNNGALSSTDAAQIARFVSGLGPPIGLTGQWRFFVPDPGFPTFPIGPSPQTRIYDPVAGNITGQDYIGILVGEVTGNWNPTAARPAGTVNGGQWAVDRDLNAECGVGNAECKAVTVDLPQLVSSADKEIVVPVNVQGIADKGVISYEFDLRYDPSVMQPVGDGVDVNGTVSRGLSVVTNAAEPGLLRVVVYGAYPIDGDGLLLNLRFTAVGESGSVSPISFERIMFNEGEARVTITDGKIELF